MTKPPPYGSLEESLSLFIYQYRALAKANLARLLAQGFANPAEVRDAFLDCVDVILPYRGKGRDAEKEAMNQILEKETTGQVLQVVPIAEPKRKTGNVREAVGAERLRKQEQDIASGHIKRV